MVAASIPGREVRYLVEAPLRAGSLAGVKPGLVGRVCYLSGAAVSDTHYDVIIAGDVIV